MKFIVDKYTINNDIGTYFLINIIWEKRFFFLISKVEEINFIIFFPKNFLFLQVSIILYQFEIFSF